MTHRNLFNRINFDIGGINTAEYPYVTISRHDDLSKIECILDSPKDCPYENGKFVLEILFPHSYPFAPPKIKFITQIYHPNISTTGEICLDMLKSTWTATNNLKTVLAAIYSLLKNPNHDDPLNGDVGALYNKSKLEFEQKAKEFTIKYAIVIKNDIINDTIDDTIDNIKDTIDDTIDNK